MKKINKKVLVTRNIIADGINILKEHGFEVDVTELDRPFTPEELLHRASDYDAIISTMADAINKNFLEKNPQLKIVTNYAVGVNNIDLEAAKEQKIKIGNTPDVLTDATAEVALGLMIAAARNFRNAIRNAEDGLWKYFEPQGHLGYALEGKKLGIIGYGRIGKRLGEMCRGAFNMDVRGFKRGENLHEFLKDLDVLSLHIPLTPESHHIIGASELSVMKKSAIVVNTARGEVIDQEALYKALKNNEIFAAGLDVTTPEPLVPSHPLYSLPNVIILPHIGSATFEARRAMSILSARNILAAFELE